MVNLKNHIEQVRDFLSLSIYRFKTKHGAPKLVGIYCCPRMGWITTNFNLTNDNTDNCADLEYVEFDIIELENWQNEYEKDSPKFVIHDRTVEHNHDLGDEHMNIIFFEYLKPIAKEIGDEFNIRILLQKLDSEQTELMKNEA